VLAYQTIGRQNQEMKTKEKTEHLSFVNKYPIVSFFILAMVLGTGTIYLVIQEVIPAELALSSALSASMAGIIMTAILDGKAGLKLMLSRVLIWRVGIGYWLFSMLFLVPAILIGSLFNPFFNGDPISLSNMKPAFNIVPMFLVFFIVSGLGQELGWTGFLMPRLQAHFGALASCAIRAILIGIWHLPLLIYSRFQPYAIPDFPYGVWIVQKGFLIAFLAMVVLFMLPWSIFLTWMFNNTKGSLLLVATLHASEIWLAYCMMSVGISSNNLDNFWGYGMVMVLTAIIIVIVTGAHNLSRKHKRIVYQQIHA
jgi:membrane protease YdiL (CAAX protease family)